MKQEEALLSIKLFH